MQKVHEPTKKSKTTMYIVSKTLLFSLPMNNRISHGIDNKLNETDSAQIIAFLYAKKRPMVQCHKSPLKLDLDPIFLSQEVLFHGTIS